MRAFTCDQCGHLVFFESTRCVHCQAILAFVPEHMEITALKPVVPSPVPGLLQPIDARRAALTPVLRMCANHTAQDMHCNFTTDADGSQPYCLSCRQTHWLPNLEQPLNRTRTSKIESAKRYLFYTLSRLGLSSLQRVRAPIFDLLEELPQHSPVLSGHLDGTITLNVIEADDDERARRRLAMCEPYRTLLGHLRHESGHFFWDILIKDTTWISAYRDHFGDERLDYAQALQAHYARGTAGPANWPQQHVSAYASSHPWEDWAETWAHYLHVIDLMETAASYRTQLRLPGHMISSPPVDDPFTCLEQPFSHILQQCVPLTLLLNSLNRSLGHNDAYPFTLSPAVISKLSFIHNVVREHRVKTMRT